MPHDMRRDFRERVERLEALARDKPRSYRFRLVLFALFGYAYIYLVLLALLGFLGLITYESVRTGSILGVILVVWLGFGFVLTLVQVLRVRVELPKGIALGRREAPRLWALVDEVRRDSGGPSVHEIRLAPNLNAGVTGQPRLGLLGWPRRILYLGVPLLESMDETEIRAVITHELAHLAGGDDRQLRWIVALAGRYGLLVHVLAARRHWSLIFFAPFFAWYIPRFVAWSAVSMRKAELAADATAARLYGADLYARGLVSVAVRAQRLEHELMPALLATAREHEAPPEGALAAQWGRLREPLEGARAEAWLERALVEWTRDADTHPALAARLEALGVSDPSLPGPVERPASELLGDAREGLVGRVEALWRDEVHNDWGKRHDVLSEEHETLQELDRVTAIGTLPEEERLQRVRLKVRHGDPQEAAALIQSELAESPDDAALHLELGRLRLAVGDAAGAIEPLRRACELRPDLEPEAATALSEAYLLLGERDAGAAALRRADRTKDRLVDADAERSVFAPTDRFLPHSLASVDHRRILNQLSADEDIEAAYLVRKVVRHFPDNPCHLLAIIGRFEGRALFPGRAARKLMERLERELVLPPGVQLRLLDSGSFHLRKVLEETPEARLFSRDPGAGF